MIFDFRFSIFDSRALAAGRLGKLAVPVLLAACLGGVMSACGEEGTAESVPSGEQKAAAPVPDPYLFTNWETFSLDQGLPHHKVLAVKVHGDNVYVGTEKGAAILDRKSKKVERVIPQESSPGAGDGLAFRVVPAIEIDDDGEVWFATLKGLTRFDGEKFTSYRWPEGQLPTDPEPKGLINGVVYGVTHLGDDIWCATTDGVSQLNKKTGKWKSWYINNSPMEEVWAYGISASPNKIWLAAWGSGLLEYTVDQDHWQVYLDPDGSFTVDLIRNDGMLTMMSTWTSFAEGVVWVSSYFGLSRYDGKNWRDWDQDHGLPSNFINTVTARGKSAWSCTDKGLAGFVEENEKWYNYARVKSSEETYGTITVSDGDGGDAKVYRTGTAIPHNFVWQVAFDDDGGVWVATSDGLGHGTVGAAGEPPMLLGPRQPAPESEWKTIPNAGQTLLPKELTQAFFNYLQEPFAKPVEVPYGTFVDTIGYVKGHYEGDTVRIGFIGCLSGPAKAYSGNMLDGARLAMEELNKAGGYFGMPFEIITRDDKATMGLDGHAMVELIFDEEVAAILGSMGSDTTHVGIRVSLKSEIPQMTSISTDPTITQVIIPWAFRILADDWSQGRAMAKLVFMALGFERVAILEQNNRYGRMGSTEIARVAQRLGHPVTVKLKYEGAAKDFTPQLKIIKDYNPDAIVIWGMYAGASVITKQARAMGMTMPIFGADGLVSNSYIEMTGPDSEGVIVTFPFNDTRDSQVTRDFIRNYQAKYGIYPDSFSAHGYDAMLTMGHAILRAGKNVGKEKGLWRAYIRDELSRTDGLEGATGSIRFDHTGNDMRVVEFAIIEGGRFVYIDEARLEALKRTMGR